MTKTFQPGDRVHHRNLDVDATVVGNSQNRVLVQYDDDGTFYAPNPYFLDPIED